MTVEPPLPFIDLAAQRARLEDRLDAAISGVLAHGKFVLGPEVGRLEDALATFSGAGHAVTCASGTDALQLSLMAAGVGRDDAVLVPTFSFVATAEAVVLAGAVPVFVDVDAKTFNMCPRSLAAAIAEARKHGLRPAAVVAVDLFGQPADYAALRDIADAEALILIADAAQSFGGAHGRVRVGRLADLTATSFFPSKPLGCYGDGGAVLTDDAVLAETLRSMRSHGKGGDKYDNVRIGMNSRLDTLQAAILLEKLSILQDELSARRRIAGRYAAALRDRVATPAEPDAVESAWALYTVRAKTRDDRDRAQQVFRDAGIPTAVYYPTPLHRQAAYSGYPTSPAGLDVSDRLSATVLSLPFHPYLDDQTQDRIVDVAWRAFA